MLLDDFFMCSCIGCQLLFSNRLLILHVKVCFWEVFHTLDVEVCLRDCHLLEVKMIFVLSESKWQKCLFFRSGGRFPWGFE